MDRRDSRYTWREKNLPWYSLHRIGVPENHLKNKIITGSILKDARFSIDDIGYLIPHGGIFAITSEQSLNMLLAYLNSKIVWFFLKSIASPKRGGYISLDVGTLSQIPVPEFNADVKMMEIEKLAGDIQIQISESEEKIREYELQIDKYFYSIFNFSEEEISYIEKILKF